MSGVFVPLDAEYDSDDKIMEAGHLAELLFVRGLAFSKRTMSDGNISRAQLVIVGRGIPSAKRQADVLVSVGLWRETAKGWHIVAWAKRNKSAQEIDQIRTARKTASIEANHKRWHVGPDGKPSATCPLCSSEPPSDDGSGVGSDLGSNSQNQSQRDSHNQNQSQRDREDPSPSTSLHPPDERLGRILNGTFGTVDKAAGL